MRQLLHEGERIGLDWVALNTSLIMGEEVLVESQREYVAAKMGMDIDKEPHRMIGSSYGAAELGLNLLFETRDTIRLRRAMRHNASLLELLENGNDMGSAPSLFCYNPLRCHIEVINCDEYGFGELCFTLLDPKAVILLPRYATGDCGKILDASMVNRACQLAECDVPWLPMVALKGRISDRNPGMPSVEEIKELIYSLPSFADHLTGAFTLSKQEGSTSIKLAIQLNQSKNSVPSSLVDSFVNSIKKNTSWPTILISFDVLPSKNWGPKLDYERKFSYSR